MSVVIFEDEHWKRFAPLTLFRHVSQMRWGTKTLLEALLEFLPGESVCLWGRDELQEVTKERLSISYNLKPENNVFIVNARARPSKELRLMLTKGGNFAAFATTGLVAARTRAAALTPGVQTTRGLLVAMKSLEQLETGPELLFQGSWEMIESNGMAIADQGSHGFQSAQIPKGTSVKGVPSNIRINESAEVDGMVSIDARLGPVVIDEQATIESLTLLSGPCYIGRRTKVHSALIRGGTSIFDNCRIGGEVENSIVMPYSNKAHDGYLGDSIVGEWVNVGAGSTFSNLKNTYGTVRVDSGRRKIDSGMTKLGAFVGDMAKVSIGTMVYAGKSLGAGSHVAGLVDRNVPSFTYFDGLSGRKVELAIDSVLETQMRMMERRGRTPSKSEEALIKFVFRRTSAERKSAKVRKGIF